MMRSEKLEFQAIGLIHSPHRELSKTPIQPVFCEGFKGTVVLNTQFGEGLKGLNGFSHIFLFYYFNKSQETHLSVIPYLSTDEQGVFATRAPHRPNKLGMSLVRLEKIEDNILFVSDIDILDGTPLLDIKPYIQRFDSRETAISGWQDSITSDEASLRGLRGFKK